MTIILKEALAFEQAADLADWFAQNHETVNELWVRIFKAGSGIRSVTWTDCVVERSGLGGSMG